MALDKYGIFAAWMGDCVLKIGSNSSKGNGDGQTSEAGGSRSASSRSHHGGSSGLAAGLRTGQLMPRGAASRTKGLVMLPALAALGGALGVVGLVGFSVPEPETLPPLVALVPQTVVISPALLENLPPTRALTNPGDQATATDVAALNPDPGTIGAMPPTDGASAGAAMESASAPAPTAPPAPIPSAATRPVPTPARVAPPVAVASVPRGVPMRTNPTTSTVAPAPEMRGVPMNSAPVLLPQATPEPPKVEIISRSEPEPPPRQEPESKPVVEKKEGENRPPREIRRVQPAYPPMARSQRISGRVVVRVMVGDSGSVEDVKVVSSPSPLLNAAAMDAAKKMTFEPSLSNGRPVRGSIDVPFEFVFR